MSDVHPSAVVDAGARLGRGVRVGPHVVVEADVEVGADTDLRAGTVLRAGSRVGGRCRLGPYAVVGSEPMDGDFDGEPSHAVLEEGVDLREFVTVHRATGEEAATRVGSGALVMCYAHVSHNVRVGAGAVLTNGAQLGGHAEVGERAVLGAGAMVHQFARVGAFAMLGAASATNRDVLPYAMARGNVAAHFRSNRVGLDRHGVSSNARRAIEDALRALRRRDEAAFEALADAHAEVAAMHRFRHSSRRGLARFQGA